MSYLPASTTSNLWAFELGGIPLTKFEVPQSFDLGHELQLAVHKYIAANGQPTIATQSLGSFYVPTKWSGILLYNTALQRALQLDALMLQGVQIPWQYGPLNYQVVIQKFVFSPHHQLEIPYQIDLQIVSDTNGQTVGVDNSVTFDAGTQDQFNAASSAIATLQGQANTQTMSVSQLAAAGIPPTSVPTTPITPDIFIKTNTVIELLQGAYPLSVQPFAVIQNIVNAIADVITTLSPMALQLENTAVLEADLAVLAACVIALNNFGLLNQNLGQLLGTSPGATVVANYTGSLFALAAIYYPLAPIDQAVELIAQANSLNDFYVYIPTNISLPPLFQ